MSFRETDHPRATDGQFATKAGATAEVSLNAESKAERRKRIGQVFRDVHSEIPVGWVVSRSDRAGQATVRASFRQVAEMTDHLDLDELDFADREAIRRVRDISTGTDPRGGSFHEQATAAAAAFADYLVDRDERLAAYDEL